ADRGPASHSRRLATRGDATRRRRTVDGDDRVDGVRVLRRRRPGHPLGVPDHLRRRTRARPDAAAARRPRWHPRPARLVPALGRVPPVGWALAVMLAAGLVFAVRQRHGFRMLRTSAATPLAMLVGAIVFLTLTGATRAWAGTAYVTSSRYLDIVVALALPAIA